MERELCMNMQMFRRAAFRQVMTKFALLTVALFLAVGLSHAQAGKKSYIFKGTVTEVKPATNYLMVDGQKVEGWMDAMTMKYEVDDPGVLKQLKVGDHIQATVYEGDYTLHKVQVVTDSGKKK